MSYIKLYTVFILTTNQVVCPFRTSRVYLFPLLLFNQVLCRFVQLCKYGHHFFFSFVKKKNNNKPLYPLSGVSREAAVCMLRGSPAVSVHAETVLFVSQREALSLYIQQKPEARETETLCHHATLHVFKASCQRTVCSNQEVVIVFYIAICFGSFSFLIMQLRDMGMSFSPAECMQDCHRR